MALSLAKTLGPKHGLQAFSVHPGVNGETGIGSHCNWEVDYPALRKLYPSSCSCCAPCYQVLITLSEAIDKAFGNPEGWATEFAFKSKQEVAATHVYASFDPNLKSEEWFIC